MCATGHVARFIIFGSFVTAKTEPNDVDIFLLMDDTFDVSKVTGETAILFDHLAAQIRQTIRRLDGLDLRSTGSKCYDYAEQ